MKRESNDGRLIARSPGGITVMFRYYLLAGDTAAPSRLYARLCHPFLVDKSNFVTWNQSAAAKLVIIWMVTVVAATKPQCNTNLSSADHTVNEFDFISVDCNVRYRGRWAPVISCEPGGRVVINSITDSHRRYVQVISASPRIHGQTIICTTTFTTHAPSFRTSSSSANFSEHPSKSYTWKSPIIRVVSKSCNLDRLACVPGGLCFLLLFMFLLFKSFFCRLSQVVHTEPIFTIFSRLIKYGCRWSNWLILKSPIIRVVN